MMLRIPRRDVLRSALAAPALLIPKSVIAACNTTVPTPAAAAGYTNCTFFDDFLTASDIDVNSTGGPGFTWWPQSGWPNAVQTAWKSWTPIGASSITVTGSILTLATDNSGFGATLASVFPNGTGFYGKVFSGGFFIEVSAMFNPANATGFLTPGSWPTLWTQSMQFLLGANKGVEIDVFEAEPQSAGVVVIGTALHDWDWSVTPNSPTQNQYSPANSLNPLNLQYHKYGVLWLPASAGAGTGHGMVQRYYDDVIIASTYVTYSPSTIAAPAPAPSNPVGVFSRMDTETFPLILGAGPNWAINVDYVSVFQLPSNACVP